MTVMDEHNQQILNRIKDEVSNICKTYKFDFNDDVNLDRYKTEIKNMIMKNYPCDTITSDINKTGWPDACIIYILQSQGCEIESIQDLTEVTQSWEYDKETKIAHLHTYPVFRLKSVRVELTMDVSKLENASFVRHTWKLNKDGTVDRMAFDWNDEGMIFHNGPVCTVCGFSFCIHCSPEMINDNNCINPKEEVI